MDVDECFLCETYEYIVGELKIEYLYGQEVLVIWALVCVYCVTMSAAQREFIIEERLAEIHDGDW